ncbi:MAG: VWA domain-containing protein, partial [Alphaproteobacteria bacterium]|nr:VWA domain-containing protein [Alphaproteobacteria bacterium]
TVDDDGLMGGNPMSDVATDLDANAGDLETTDETIFKGVLDGSFGKDGAGGFCFSDTLNGTTAMLGQETVTYAVSNGGLLLTATGPRGDLFTVAITDALTGAFTLTLLKNVLHIDDMADDENDALLDIPYVVKDSDGSEATGTLKATFDDDVPVGGCAEETATAGSIKTNLMLILDTSGSMANLSGIAGLSRLDAAKLAMIDLIDQYDAVGDLAVRIVTFAANGQEIGPIWTTASAAKMLIMSSLPGASGTTNYDDALANAQTAYVDPGKIPGAQNVSYFLSDGNPNPTSAGIDATEETAWETFVDNNDIVSFALGMGTGISATNLNPIAYNGVVPAEANAIIVTDFNQLSSTLVSTVSGELATGTIVADYGADGNGGMAALLATGTPPAGFTYELSGDDLIVKQGPNAVIKVTLDAMTGDYVITQTGAIDPAMLMNQIEFIFNVSIKDGDGDKATTQIKLDLEIETNATAGSIDIIVDEDDLPIIGNMDMALGDDDPLNVSGILPHDFGPDGAGSIKLTGGSEPAGYTFTPNMDGSLLTVNDGTNDILTVTLNTADGTYSVQLLTSADHPTAGTEDNLDFTLTYEVLDSDDITPALGTINLSIDDDLPVAIDPAAAMLTNVANAMTTADLDADSNIDDNVGADQVGKLTFANIVSGVTQATGIIGMSMTSEPLTFGGDAIILFLSNNDMTLEGWVGDPMMGGTKIFTVELLTDGNIALANDEYKVTIHQPIDNGGGITFNNLTGTGPAGSEIFKIVDSGQGLEVLLTPGDITSDTDLTGGTINSDNDDIGISDQFIDVVPTPDTLRIDFGQFSITMADQFDIDSHEGVNGVGFQIFQTGANDTNQVDVLLTVYDADGDNVLNDDSGLRDTITKIEIYAADGTTLIDEATGDGAGSNGANAITFDFDGVNGVTVNNLVQGQFVRVFTGDDFNRLEITNVTDEMAQNDQFSIGGLSVQSTTVGDPIELDYDLALMDADGDTVTIVGAIDITLNPEQPIV